MLTIFQETIETKSGTTMTTGGTTISAITRLKRDFLPGNDIRAKAKAARLAMNVARTTAPTVRIRLLVKRMKNFSPASAVLKLARVGSNGSPHLLVRYCDLVLNAETAMK